jgi:hypothetical protein
MNRRSILTKTGKGLMEATGKTSNLSRDLRNVLKEIDGKVSVSDLLEKLDKFNEPRLLEALGGLERDGYVREFLGPQDTGGYAPIGRAPISQAPSNGGEDLDFTAFTPKPPSKEREDASRVQAIRAREEASARAKAEAAARARAEAEQRARAAALARQPKPEARPAGAASGQAQALDQARREAEERQRREAEEKARREAEARARIEAEDRVKREAEERQRMEIQERTRREEEEKARREAEARLRREAEERARKEAEDRRRREIEEQLRREEVERRLREEQERVRREAEEKERRLREERERAERMVRIEAEARAKVEAEERARREREEQAKREIEERLRREEELQRRSEEEARRRRETQEREAREARERMKEQDEAARRELEQKIREEEERERREQEERARREQEERARQEEEKAAAELEDIFPEEEDEERTKEEAKRAKQEERRAREEERARAKSEAKAAEKARKAARSRERAGEEVFRGDEGALVQERARATRRAADWAKRRSGSPIRTIGAMLVIALIIGVAALPFVPIDSAPYEKAAEDWLGVPVKIGSTTVALVPSPHLKFEKLVIGDDPRIRVATVRAAPELGSLTSERKAFRSLDLDGVAFPSKYVPVLLSNKGKGNLLRVARITAKKLKLDIPDVSLPPLDVEAKLGADGAVQSVVLSNAERKLSVTLMPQGRRAAIEISADAFPLPIGGDLAVGEFAAKGTITAGELTLNEVEGRAFGGRLRGNARMRWTESWTLDGEISARGVEAAKLAAPILAGGTLEGKGVYGMRASAPEKLFASARFDGNFTIQKGSITNVDMTRILQGSSTGGGTTTFSEMSGSVSADPNRLLVRQLRLAAGLLHGTGQVELDSQKNLSGRMQIELRAQTVQARATLGVTGTLKDPQFRRAN